MNAGHLHNKVVHAINSDKFCNIYDALREYQISHCYHPLKIRVFNSVLGIYEMRDVPCGKCPHCLETKSNEWVTRMAAHLEDFKYCYFITLTYRSFEPDIVNKRNSSKFVLFDYLKDSLFMLDSNNSTGHYSWNPCVLVKKHYQNFLKRLRLLVGSPISYVCKGEYGRDWARPHYHLVLYCNEPITESQIKHAWSLVVCCHNGKWKQKTNHKTDKVSHLLIGHVDYNDLVTNGTIPDPDKNYINVDGQMLSMKKCFSYVSKYLTKDEFNFKRVKRSYHAITNVLDALEPLYHDDYVIYMSNKEIQYIYETNQIYCESLQAFQIDDFGQVYRLFPSSWFDFQRLFKPFHECSRGQAIGCLFIQRNLQKYLEGVEVRPRFQKAGFICPNYFKRKVDEYLFGLRSTSHTPSHCATKGNLSLTLSHFAQDSENEILRVHGINTESYYGQMDFFNSRYAFRDLATGSRWLIPFDPYKLCFCDDSVYAHEYKYCRKTKQYIEINKLPLKQFIDLWTSKFQSYYERYISIYNQSVISHQLFCDVVDLCNEFISGESCDITPFDAVLESVQSSLLKDIENLNQRYNSTHINSL